MIIKHLNQSANGVEPIFPTANFRRYTDDVNKSCYIQQNTIYNINYF